MLTEKEVDAISAELLKATHSKGLVYRHGSMAGMCLCDGEGNFISVAPWDSTLEQLVLLVSLYHRTRDEAFRDGYKAAQLAMRNALGIPSEVEP